MSSDEGLDLYESRLRSTSRWFASTSKPQSRCWITQMILLSSNVTRFSVWVTWSATPGSASATAVSCRAKLLFIPKTPECCNLADVCYKRLGVTPVGVTELGSALQFTCTSTSGCAWTTASGCGSLFVWGTMKRLLVKDSATRHKKVVMTCIQHVSSFINAWMVAQHEPWRA